MNQILLFIGLVIILCLTIKPVGKKLPFPTLLIFIALGMLLGGDLTAALPGVFSPAAAASFLVFTALYAPCVAAQAAMRQELGSRLGTLAAAIGSCAAAWCAAAVVYHIAVLL